MMKMMNLKCKTIFKTACPRKTEPMNYVQQSSLYFSAILLNQVLANRFVG